MDTLNHLPDQVPWLEVLIFIISIICVITAFNYTVLNDSDEQPANCHVPLPKQCDPEWKGEVLEQPSIKVPM
jgi:hypothetical protein